VVSDPGLVPNFSGGVVNAEALAMGTFCVLIIFVYYASIENARDFGARDRGGGVVGVEGVPITEPEIELVIFGGGAGSRRRGLSWWDA